MRRTRISAAAALCLVLAGCTRGATPLTPSALEPGRPAWSDNVPPPAAPDTCTRTTSTTLRGGNAFGSGT